jgi:hypothetical protein
MPGCVLRIASKTSNVEALVKTSGFRPIVVYRKGLPRVPGGTSLHRVSGFNVDVCGDGLIEQQASVAVGFLKHHARALARLRRDRRFGGMELDFGLYDCKTPSRPWPSYRLPAALIQLAGKHRIEIVLSFYSTPKERNG